MMNNGSVPRLHSRRSASIAGPWTSSRMAAKRYLSALAALAFLSSIHYSCNLGRHDEDSSSSTIRARERVVKIAEQPYILVGERGNSSRDVGGGGGGDPYALARNESFGFFYDIAESHWERYKQIFLEHVNHRYPDKPWAFHPESQRHESLSKIYAGKDGPWAYGWASNKAWYQNNYEPNFSCQFERRVGIPMNGDGAKWICDPHRIKALAKARKDKDPSHPGCVVYSVGSSGNFDFELGLESVIGEGVCEIHIFDFGYYEGEMNRSGLKRAYFHRWGLMERVEEPRSMWGLGRRKAKSAPTPTEKYDKDKKLIGQFYSLRDTVELLGHRDLDMIDIFKIDCEGCEWDTYRDWTSVELPMLHQILVEVHGAPKDKALDFYDSLEEEGYLRFHKEPNIQWDPSCIEYAFIRVDRAFARGKELARGNEKK